MIVISHWLTFVANYVILSKINVTNKVGQFKTVRPLVLNVSFICDKTSPGKGGMIGTMYRNSSSSTNNNYLSFQIFTRRSCEPQVQERACPTRTYVCLAKHYSKQPIGAPRLNLVPASPKLYKVDISPCISWYSNLQGSCPELQRVHNSLLSVHSLHNCISRF